MSGDLFRPQGDPASPPVVINSLQHPMGLARCCWDTYGTGTEVLVLPGSAGAVFRQRRTTNADNPTPHRPMQTIQLTINGNQVQGDIEQIAKILGMVTETVTQQVDAKDEELLPFNQFSIKELTPHFGQQLAESIVDKLEKCAKMYCPDFRHFIGMYQKVGNIEQRQLLKTISAVYRLKFGHYANAQSHKSSLRSIIKYASICPHCGKLAQSFIVRLQKEGLM